VVCVDDLEADVFLKKASTFSAACCFCLLIRRNSSVVVIQDLCRQVRLMCEETLPRALVSSRTSDQALQFLKRNCFSFSISLLQVLESSRPWTSAVNHCILFIRVIDVRTSRPSATISRRLRTRVAEGNTDSGRRLRHRHRPLTAGDGYATAVVGAVTAA